MIRQSLPAAVIAGAMMLNVVPASAQTIVDEWSQVVVPPAPALKPVTVEAKTTALLVMDFVKQSCNENARPRCVASIPKMKTLIANAKAKGVEVIWTLPPGPKPEDFLPEVAPPAGTRFIVAPVDKFLGTDLEKTLKEHGIATVITVGTAAQGAVLYTASEAALRGFHVIVPVDGMSGTLPYSEQVTAWTLANAPTVANNVILTRSDMITIEAK